MTAADATTVQLPAPWAVARHRRRREDFGWGGPSRAAITAFLLAVLFGTVRFVANAVIDIAICAAVFVIVLIAGSALFELILWRR